MYMKTCMKIEISNDEIKGTGALTFSLDCRIRTLPWTPLDWITTQDGFQPKKTNQI